MRQTKLTVQYSFIQGLFWMGFAAVMGFSSLFLLNAGYTSSQVGLLIAVANLVSTVLQPIIAAKADDPKAPSARKFIMVLSAGITLGAVGLLFIRGRILAGLVYGVCVALLQSFTGLVNAIGITGNRRPNFGIGRAFGSAGYASMSLALGIIAERMGVMSVPVSMVLCFCALITCTFFYPESKTQGAADQKAADSPVVFLRRYPRYGLVLVGLVLIFLSHNFLTSYTYQIAVAKGGGSREMGNAMAIAAVIETPPMFLILWMLKKARSHVWLRISGFFFGLKNLAILLTSTIMGFYGGQLFQIFGWGLLTACSVYYINAIMKPEDAVKGQAYYTVSMTLGNVFGALLGGWLIDAAGVSVMLAVGTAAAFAGAFIILFSAQKTEV